MTAEPISKALPANYPSEWIETVTLANSEMVTIRPILPGDAPRLQEGFTHLSSESIYYRFLDTAKQLSDKQANQLANLDYLIQMALVASIVEEGDERLVGVARYALVGEKEPGAAETAVVVRDDFQGRGLGTLLYERLIRYARQHGVKYFTSTIHQSNAKVMKFIRKSGLTFEREMIEPGVFLVRIFLEPPV
jgi:acetyltransferase